MNDRRQKALEDFLNDPVKRISLGFYKWRGKTYQVITMVWARSRKMKTDSFIKWTYNLKCYYIREMSNSLLRQYKLTIDK
jgi:hypothetical protein